MRRFVFVPLCGSEVPANWLELPHIKAWGFLDDLAGEPPFIAIHTEGDDGECIPLNERCDIFSAEIEAAIDIPENSTDLPDEVCIALAKLALLPVSPAN